MIIHEPTTFFQPRVALAECLLAIVALLLWCVLLPVQVVEHFL